MMHTTIDVSGMSCGGCEAAVEDAVGSLDGVRTVAADHESDAVEVEMDDGTPSESLHEAIRDAGYEVADA